ncbi:MFS transporter [Novosphingobium sp. 11B]
MKEQRSRRTLAAASIGNFGEIYDFAIFGFSVPVLSVYFFPAAAPETAVLGMFAVYAVALFARPVGGVLFGALADRIGRIKVLSLTIWMMAAGTMIIGLLPTYASIGLAAPVLLVLCRLAQGLAMGGETSGSTSFVIESAPEEQRGRWIGWIWFFGFLPNAFAATFLLVIQSLVGSNGYMSWAWRIPFLVGGLIGIVGIWLRQSLHDPEEFRQARAEKKAAETFMSAVTNPRNLKAMLQVLLLESILAVSSYLLLAFMYTFLVRQVGMEPRSALLTNATAITISAIFMPISGALSDRIGRRRVILMGAVWITLAAYPAVALAATGEIYSALLGQTLLAIGIGLYAGAAFTIMPELFPTTFRATGHAISYQLAVAVFGGTTPFIATWLVGVFDTKIAPGIYTTAVCGGALLLLRWIPETKGISLRTAGQETGGATKP